MDEVNPRNMPGGDARVKQGYAFGVVAALLVIASFVAGVFVGDLRHGASAAAEPIQFRNVEDKPAELADLDFGEYWRVWRTIKEKYVKEPPSDMQLFYGSISGLVSSLDDPYSVFFDPQEAAEFTTELSGEFSGIGAEIGKKEDKLTVIAPLPGTPADRAGIRAGDWIIAIDDVDTFDMSVDDAVSRIRGEKGTTVRLSIMREDFEEPKEFAIVRDLIVIEAVKWKYETKDGKRYAHVIITHFNDKVAAQFSEAARRIATDGADGVVLDLRNNPGGFLDTAVDVAGEWVPEGIIVDERFSDGSSNPYMADGRGRLAAIPTVVLVNGGSASASEIVAGALKDHDKATIVGEKTFGKGSVQDFTEYEDGAALKLTVALWYTPNGRNIDKEGIAPDVEVPFTAEDAEKDLDPQLAKAYEILAGKK